MAKLVIIARNVSGHASPFHLYGFFPEDVPEEGGMVQLVPPVVDMQKAPVKIQTDAGQTIPAGEDFAKEGELGALDFDITKLKWKVPVEFQQRFVLRCFSIDGKPIVPGLPCLM